MDKVGGDNSFPSAIHEAFDTFSKELEMTPEQFGFVYQSLLEAGENTTDKDDKKAMLDSFKTKLEQQFLQFKDDEAKQLFSGQHNFFKLIQAAGSAGQDIDDVPTPT
jgi:hypothetical protein